MSAHPTDSIGDELCERVASLSRRVARLRFEPPVHTVYNPLAYAREPLEIYLRRFARRGVENLLVGMNPGPFGMVQTGIPFGEIESVRTFLGIEGKVRKPRNTHAKRPIQGFDCTRREVSGQRVWGFAADRFTTPEAFFKRFFVWNWCPLAFLEDSGRNRTPDKLPANERAALERACDQGLRELVEALEPKRLIGIGKVAEGALTRIFGKPDQSPYPIGSILHPSPASPLANRGWQPAAEKDFAKLGVQLPGAPKLSAPK